MPKLTSETITVGQLFSQEYFFRVPEYQRPFLWDDDNLIDLIDDLIAAPRNREYFLGTLVLHRRTENDFDIVDGQQRLTALCLLLAAIRDCPSLDGMPLRRQLHEKLLQPAKELDDVEERSRIHVRDEGTWNSLVLANGGTRADVEASQSSSERRYKLARDIFVGRLDQMGDQEVEELAKFVSQKCVVIFLAAESFDDAYELFTIVNDRGRQLRRIDILKAANLAPDVVVNEDLRSSYAHKWEGMEERLGDTRFEELFHHLRLIYVRDKPQVDLMKEFDRRVFGQPGMPSKGTEFIDAVSSYVDLYDALFVDRDYLEGRDEHAKFSSLMYIMLGEFSASEWKACILAFASSFGPDHVYDYLVRLEKVYFTHWVKGGRKDERYSIYTDLLAAISVNDHAATVVSEVAVADDDIREACERDNFYGTSFAKYFLLRAELLAGELGAPREFGARSVEHVLPQNPEDDSQWRTTFTDEEREDLVHTSGNLVLLSKSKNSSASRRDFVQKKKTYLQTRVSDFPRSIKVLGFADWTPEVVRERTAAFADELLGDL